MKGVCMSLTYKPIIYVETRKNFKEVTHDTKGSGDTFKLYKHKIKRFLPVTG